MSLINPSLSLSEPFIRRPVMTLLLTASAILFGVLAYQQLPVNDLPAVDYPVIQVQVALPRRQPADDGEQRRHAARAAVHADPRPRAGHQQEHARATARLTLQFALDKSIDAAATDVQTAITQATGQLPTDLPSPPTFSKTNPNDQPIMYIALTSDSMTPGAALRLRQHAGRPARSASSAASAGCRCTAPSRAVRIKADPSALAPRGHDDGRPGGRRSRAARATRAPASSTARTRTFLLQPQGQLDNGRGVQQPDHRHAATARRST